MTRHGDIERLARTGARVPARLLDIRHLASPSRCPRAAIVVAKHGCTAAARNKLKRRLRELVRTIMLPHLGSVDLLVRARREAYGADFAALRDDVTRATATLIGDPAREPDASAP